MSEIIRKGPLFFRAKSTFSGDYTERQLAILNDDVPIDQIRTTELAIIIKKATERMDDINLDIAQSLYDIKKNPYAYTPRYSMEESMHILESLTPWNINWDAKAKD